MTGERVAIKKIENALAVSLEAKRLLREIRLLRHLKHANIIQIKVRVAPATRQSRSLTAAAPRQEILRPSNAASFRDLYLVYELMDTECVARGAIPRRRSPPVPAHSKWHAATSAARA